MPLIVGCGNCIQCGEEVEVRCADGTVRGVEVRTCYGPQFVRFAGVPYAKPPIGPLRFLPPVPMGRWETTIDATSIKKDCWVYDNIEDGCYGTEDCLHTTIQVPLHRQSQPMPVMVWIGGWGFYFNDYKAFGYGWFAEENVVVVHVSFRMGPFGFLSIREATAPGNCGLKDVVMALQWIQRNISAFGGDPDNVTLFGTGSGASMVHYMLLSPMATGLFHKVIVQSGSALHHWACTYHPIDDTKTLAKELNVDTKDMTDAVEMLRTFSGEEIMKAFGDIVRRQTRKQPFFAYFKPCVEVEFEGQPAFLTQYPYFLFKSGKFNRVPLMIGSNRHEGKGFLYFLKHTLNGIFQTLNVNLSSLVPPELGFEDSSHGLKNFGQRLLQFYVRGEQLTEENSEDFFNFLTDYYFTYYINKCVKTHAKYADQNPTFYYILEAASDWHMPKGFDILKESASLGSELVFLFQMYSCGKYGGGGESNRIRKKMLKLWTNFARYSNPTPDKDDDLLHVTWNPVIDPKRINYLSIGSDLTKGCNPFYERMSFWDAVYDDTTHLRIAAFFDTNNTDNDSRMNWNPI